MVYHVNTHGSLCTTFDISATCQTMVFGDAGGSLCILDSMWEISITEFWAATVLVAIGNQKKNIDGETIHQSGNLCSAVMLQVVMFYSYGVNCVVKGR